jgi:hypothetical protein
MIDVDPEQVAFTLHILFKQLNSWHNIKQTSLSDFHLCTNIERVYGYVQVLNVFI